MNIMRWFEATSMMAAVQLFTALSAFGFQLDPFFDPEPPSWFAKTSNMRCAPRPAASSMTGSPIVNAIS